jgi:hypothetical protein
MQHEDDEDGSDEAMPLPGDAKGYLALLDEHGWFEDLPPAYAAQARKGVEAAYAKGAHPASGLAIHSVAHEDDAEPIWFATMINDIVARSHGVLALEGPARVQKNKRGDYVAKAKAAGQDLQETLYDAHDETNQDPILGIAVLLERSLEARDVQDVNVGYFTDEARVLHWYLRPRDLPVPIGLVPDDLEDLAAGLDDDDDDFGEDADEDGDEDGDEDAS